MPFELGGSGGGLNLDDLFGGGGGAGGATVNYADGSSAGWGPNGEMVLSGGGDAFGGGGGGMSGGAGASGTVPYMGIGGTSIGSILKMIGQSLGTSITLSGVVALVSKVGPMAAAAALGIGGDLLLKLIASGVAKKGHRRRRGITGRQLQGAKRVIRTMHSFQKALSGACGPARTRTIVVGKKR